MKIGSTELDGVAFLAPMAGVADRAFRELCVEFGASWCVSEMVSIKGLTMHDRKSKQLMQITETERPMSIQLFGDDPVLMARAVEMALEHSPQAIDINMGCPAPKINSGGAGAAMMKNPQLCFEVTRAAVEAAGSVPVTVKIRKGWDENSVNCVEVAKLCEQAGASAIAVHGRTRMQMYMPSADWQSIADVKRAVSIPVIGNGDIYTAQDAARMLEETGCDGIMVGRGALGNPWLFSQIRALLMHDMEMPAPSIYERMRVMRLHIVRMVEYKGEHTGMSEARKHTAWYMRSMHGAAKLRRECGTLKTIGDLDRLIMHVIEANENHPVEEDNKKLI